MGGSRMDIWERLKDAKYKQGKTKVSVLIADEEELDDSPVEDNESAEVLEDFFIAEGITTKQIHSLLSRQSSAD